MIEVPSADRWQQVSKLLDRLLDRSPEVRLRMLQSVGAQDPALRRYVEILLAADAEDAGLLDCRAEQLARWFAEASKEGDEAAAEDLVDALVGPYRVRGELGRGGMGVVLLAERADGQFEQRVALKLIKRGLDTDEILARFRRERQILAGLRHPNIARLLDGGASEDGRPYFAMEYVEGEPLLGWCAARRLGLEARLRLFLAVCRAVQYAHASLVVHRDLKPSNVLVDRSGEVKLLDFGIAKLLTGEEEGELTRLSGQRLTPAYAAPEQLRGEPATTAADVYGLGRILEELLPPRERASGRSRDLAAILETATADEPTRRYGSAEGLAEDVRRFLDGLPVRARRPTLSYRTVRFVSRHRVGVAAVSVVLVSLISGLVGTLWQSRARAVEARRAEEIRDFLLTIFEVSDPSEARGREITARELLDRGARRIESELVSQPEVRAEMLGTIGELYRRLGLLDRAGPMLEQALRLERAQHGADGAETAAALHRWGSYLWDRGDYHAAAEALEKAVELRRRAGSDELSATLASLAAVLNDLGRHERAEALHREALQIDRRRFGDLHPAVATDLYNLAVTRWTRSQFDGTEGLFRDALRLRRRALGEEHPDVAEVLHGLGMYLSSRGRYDEAEESLRRALALHRRLYGSRHPQVALTLDGLALLQSRRDSLQEAEGLYREALAIRRQVLGPDHPDVATTLNNLGTLCYRMANWDCAEENLRDALDIWRRRLGEEHRNVASATSSLGMVLREKGTLDEAERLVLEGLGLRRRLFGERHLEVVVGLKNAGLVWTDRKGLEEAEAALEEALGMVRELVPRGHRRELEVLVALGRLRLAQDRPLEAEALLREAWELSLAGSAAEGREAGEASFLLAVALARQSRWDEARNLLTGDSLHRVSRNVILGHELLEEACSERPTEPACRSLSEHRQASHEP